MSHRYEADDLSVAKWLEGRQQNQILRVLLIVNPTKDLDGAQREGDRVEKLLNGKGLAQVRRLDGDEARRTELLRCFQSGDFDVVHYAGHAFFDPNAPSRSGILCAGREVLAGADLAGLSNLPSLVFFNACQIARIRRLSDEPSPPEAPVAVRRSIGFAEAFLRGGVANFVGTYWPVGDMAAEIFAPAFYENLLAGRPLSEALLTSRRALEAKDLGDWADYILYGDPDFILKRV
jgi:CHAT domain-containing protein